MLAPNVGASGGVPYGHGQQGRPSCRRLHVNPPLRRKPGEDARPWCGFAEIWPSRPDGSSHRSCRPCGIGRSTFQATLMRGAALPLTRRSAASGATAHGSRASSAVDPASSSPGSPARPLTVATEPEGLCRVAASSPPGFPARPATVAMEPAFPLDQSRSRWSPQRCAALHTGTHDPRRSWGPGSSIFQCMRLCRINYRLWVASDALGTVYLVDLCRSRVQRARTGSAPRLEPRVVPHSGLDRILCAVLQGGGSRPSPPPFTVAATITRPRDVGMLC